MDQQLFHSIFKDKVSTVPITKNIKFILIHLKFNCLKNKMSGKIVYYKDVCFLI
jgi:hypothetical protein